MKIAVIAKKMNHLYINTYDFIILIENIVPEHTATYSTWVYQSEIQMLCDNCPHKGAFSLVWMSTGWQMTRTTRDC
jgi:hypothetical protein